MKNFFNKKFSTKTKLISSAISLMLIVCFAITGTVAWLMDATEEVTDTFTYGKVEIKLIDANNNVEWSATVHKNAYDAGLYTTENNEGKFKLIPGATFDFNPAVQVVDGSEPCYIFVKIEPQNNLTDFVTIQLTNGWIGIGNNVYAYATTTQNVTSMTKVEAGNTTNIINAGKLLVNNTVTSESIKNAVEPKVQITAYAIQSEYLVDNQGNTLTAPADIWALINN